MANENLTRGNERTSPLDPILTKLVGRREGERGEKTERGKKEEEESFRERISHFSLEFPTIGQSNPDETKGKVDPHCKSYAWVPVLWSFEKLQEVGVFSYLC